MIINRRQSSNLDFRRGLPRRMLHHAKCPRSRCGHSSHPGSVNPVQAGPNNTAVTSRKLVAITGGKLLTITHGTIENGVIVLEDGKIPAVGPAASTRCRRLYNAKGDDRLYLAGRTRRPILGWSKSSPTKTAATWSRGAMKSFPPPRGRCFPCRDGSHSCPAHQRRHERYCRARLRGFRGRPGRADSALWQRPQCHDRHPGYCAGYELRG